MLPLRVLVRHQQLNEILAAIFWNANGANDARNSIHKYFWVSTINLLYVAHVRYLPPSTIDNQHLNVSVHGKAANNL